MSAKRNSICTNETFESMHEREKELIHEWRQKRLHSKDNVYHEFILYSCSLKDIRSFLQNVNFMVIFQVFIATASIYLCQHLEISFDIPYSLYISPIVFPLAFAINTDFQRREKVLEDLALFKSSGMVLYFCMREWKQPALLDAEWIKSVHDCIKSLLFNLCEYLVTHKPDPRKVILRAIYEDFSKCNQLIESLRNSELPANTAIVSRAVHLLQNMCLSVERLRVVREYRSPRSIRSLNKVFIMLLPIILAPFFVHKRTTSWEAYYIAIPVAFVLSALQAVQDKLDDPFDGMGEDDINLDQVDTWAFGSAEHNMKRSFSVGRFKVNIDPKYNLTEKVMIEQSPRKKTFKLRNHLNSKCRKNTKNNLYKKHNVVLESKSGTTRITKKDISSCKHTTNVWKTDDLQGNSDEINDIESNSVHGNCPFVESSTDKAGLCSSNKLIVSCNKNHVEPLDELICIKEGYPFNKTQIAEEFDREQNSFLEYIHCEDTNEHITKEFDMDSTEIVPSVISNKKAGKVSRNNPLVEYSVSDSVEPYPSTTSVAVDVDVDDIPNVVDTTENHDKMWDSNLAESKDINYNRNEDNHFSPAPHDTGDEITHSFSENNLSSSSTRTLSTTSSDWLCADSRKRTSGEYLVERLCNFSSNLKRNRGQSSNVLENQRTTSADCKVKNDTRTNSDILLEIDSERHRPLYDVSDNTIDVKIQQSKDVTDETRNNKQEFNQHEKSISILNDIMNPQMYLSIAINEKYDGELKTKKGFIDFFRNIREKPKVSSTYAKRPELSQYF